MNIIAMNMNIIMSWLDPCLGAAGAGLAMGTQGGAGNLTI
jgi:hypothetical protein